MLIVVILLIGALVGGFIKLAQHSAEKGHAEQLERAHALHQKIKRKSPEHPVAQLSPREMQMYYKRARHSQIVVPWLMIAFGILLFSVALPLLESPGIIPLLSGIGAVLGFVASTLYGVRMLRKRRGQEWFCKKLSGNQTKSPEMPALPSISSR
jgi:Flp pilus assembly protein TadB